MCDADPTNDGTTCTQTSSEPELPDSVDPEEEINSEEETQIALPEQEFEEQEETFFEPPVFGEPEE